MTNPTPKSTELFAGLSTKARNALIHLKVKSHKDLIALSMRGLSRTKGCGMKTATELERLLERVRLEAAQSSSPLAPSLPSERGEGTATACNEPDASVHQPFASPPQWSVLNRTLSELSAVAASPCRHENPATFRLPPADLERLRARGIFPEDAVHLLYSFSVSYLLETGLSDPAISSLLHALARISGLPGDILPMPAMPPADLSMYEGFPSGLLDPLIVTDFPFPALLDTADGPTETVSWSVVAEITECAVFRRLGFSVAALRAIRYLWQLQARAVTIAESAAAGIPTASYHDFDQLLDRYLQVAVREGGSPPATTKRFALEHRLLRERIAPTPTKVPLRKLGHDFGISGERVRQVETKLLLSLQHEGNVGHLTYLWHLLDRLMVSGGGGRYAEELCLSLQRMHGWSSPPPQETLVILMGFSPRYRVVPESSPVRVALTAPSCVGCETAGSAVLDAIEASAHSTLSLNDTVHVMLGACKRAQCPELRKIATFSLSLVHFIADSAPTLEVHDQALHLELPQSRFRHVAELAKILRSAPDGMHFKEAHRLVKLVLPEIPARASAVHSRLAAAKWAVLWGLGIFKHRDLLSIPVSLISKIQKDFASTLDLYDVPYHCANGRLFDKYADLLQKKGVPTSRALYSCMKIVGSPILTFEEFPYVLRKDHAVPRPPIHELLEQFIATGKGVTSYNEMNNFLVEKLGVPTTLVGFHLKMAHDIIRIGNVFLHAGNVQLVTDRLRSIVNAPSPSNEKNGSAKAGLFQKHRLAYEAMGIKSPRELSSLVERFLPGTQAMPVRKKLRKERSDVIKKVQGVADPVSETADRPVARTSQPPADWVYSYLEDMGKPCRTKDLFSAFRTGPQQTHLYKRWLGNREKVLWYTRESVIALKSLEWSNEKQYAIEALALMHLEQGDGSGKPYGACCEICRDMHGELPELAQDLAWTPVLLHSLLVSGANFLSIGRHKDFFVAKDNAYRIATLDDFLYHALLTDYGGSASKKSLIAAYSKIGIKLSPAMHFLAGKDSRVVVDGDVIRAADGAGSAKGFTKTAGEA